MSPIEVMNVVFACPGNTEETYARGARPLAEFYAELLGMHIIREDWFLIGSERSPLQLAFGDGPIDYHPPRWPDPAFPQQMHLDITVDDLSHADHRARTLGATTLRQEAAHTVYADPAGHPFCLYAGPPAPDGTTHLGRVDRIVIDCPDPQTLASFYAALLDLPTTELNTPDRIVITRPNHRPPALAFQRSQSPMPRWPDPAHPQQVHLDLKAPNPPKARAQATHLGALLLQTSPTHTVHQDPAGHPFCL